MNIQKCLSLTFSLFEDSVSVFMHEIASSIGHFSIITSDLELTIKLGPDFNTD